MSLLLSQLGGTSATIVMPRGAASATGRPPLIAVAVAPLRGTAAAAGRPPALGITSTVQLPRGTATAGGRALVVTTGTPAAADPPPFLGRLIRPDETARPRPAPPSRVTIRLPRGAAAARARPLNQNATLDPVLHDDEQVLLAAVMLLG